ncbi:hypothetical protein [Flavobacterium litorale]|uniref:Peptidylprolyl isomerase n=1 Tax=Flavobacterium litorale TaxID=2856519 RepID=A0ABX8VCV3_9FLAO|nr:hypothetical protein [Flavobacterium litorale]QYJ68871.1 hypothetical protein K1I41_03025 [Flavobacterium litorale]
MKYLVLFFFFAITLNAQSVDIAQDSIGKGLSESELQIAKQQYLEMIQTDNYIQYKKNIKVMVQKLNGLQMFPQEKLDEYLANGKKIEELSIEEYRKKWLEENIKKTDFKSVEEALKFYKSTEVLLEKTQKSYEKLYQFIAKANIEQIKEITLPSKPSIYDVMDDSLKY